MSDENKIENRYQPPAPSDESLAKKDAGAPKAKPHPANWWIPWLGYGYVPLVIGLLSVTDDSNYDRYFAWLLSVSALFFLLPVYGLVILGLMAQRILRKTNSVGLTLFQILSMVLPILWLFLVMSFNGSPA